MLPKLDHSRVYNNKSYIFKHNANTTRSLVREHSPRFVNNNATVVDKKTPKMKNFKKSNGSISKLKMNSEIYNVSKANRYVRPML